MTLAGRTTGARLLVALTALATASGALTNPGPAAPDDARNASAGRDTSARKGRAPTPVELTPAVEAAFADESYRPNSTATLTVFNRARGLRLRIYRVGPERVPTRDNITMNGIAVTHTRLVGSTGTRTAIPVRIGSWPSGLYFARLEAIDGRVGFAPLVVRPRRLGAHRVAVVMPTLTWQAYNLRDDDGDGLADSWYARWTHRTVRLGRPFLNRGVPSYFRRYDLPFLHWLARTGRQVDVLAQSDLERVTSAARLASVYDLIVFPGHHEYVTTREYDVIEAYRDLGGSLMFLSANNLFWRVVRRGRLLEKTRMWRDLGRPEAGLIGVQYLANDRGTHRAPWVVTNAPATSWIFAGTTLRSGSPFARGGIEIDHTTIDSPRGTQVVARIADVFGPGYTAEMTYYRTPSGAQVFAAGAFRLLDVRDRAIVERVLANVWRRLAA